MDLGVAIQAGRKDEVQFSRGLGVVERMPGRLLDEGAVTAGTVPLVTEVVLGEVPELRPASGVRELRELR